VCTFLASVFSFAIIWKVDFAALGAPAKRVQSIIEGVLALIFFGALLLFYPRADKDKVDEKQNKV